MGDVWGALADPTRRRILGLLKERDMNAGEIAGQFNISKPSVSHHLNLLRQADLVRSEKAGQNVIYTLNASVFEEILQLVSDLVGRKEENV